ncbi:unnamed protein product [Peniophora sp. CBMAI 1063]|nr:unnamed protein product [Peniophora sp. CBMAI 1063]
MLDNTITSQDAEQGTYILDLPPELLLHILSLVSARDILAFRHTSKRGDAISRDHTLWLDLLRWQREYLPLPSIVRDDANLITLDSISLEGLVVSAQKSCGNWLKSRQRPLYLGGTPDEPSDILYLDILLDEFVICVHSNGSILAWKVDDIAHDESPALSWELWADEPYTSAYACVDEASKIAYVAVTRTQHPTQTGSTTSLVTLHLSLEPSSIAEPEDDEISFCGAQGQIVRAIDVRRQLIAFSRVSFIDVIHWPSKTGMSINTHTDDLEELWNGIIGLSFVDDRLLCIRARSLELYPLAFPFPEHASYTVPSSLEPEELLVVPSAALIRPVAVYNFIRTNFRTLSLSSVSVKEFDQPVSTRTTTLFLLGNDVLRGVYQYRIDITDVNGRPDDTDLTTILPNLNVSLLSMYTRLDGFVVAVALGPQGRRGALIERTRSSTARRVLAFTCPLTTTAPSSPSSAGGSAAGALTAESEGKSDDDEQDPVLVSMRDLRPLDVVDVYNIHSLDLRQDILHLAFSEVTGRIALGTRSGDVRLI